jgi:hypothetical protein
VLVTKCGAMKERPEKEERNIHGSEGKRKYERHTWDI